MPMLEATIHKKHRLILWQNNVRCARQLSDLNTETQTTREKILPHNHLRLRILPFDSRHIATPVCGELYIRQGSMIRIVN